MNNERLTGAVTALLQDRRLTSRFRRDPERALRRFGLDTTEIEAVKRGDATELVRLGLDPRCVWPEERGQAVRSWILRNAGRVSPVVFVAACLAGPAAVAATPSRARRVVRCAFTANRARCIRAVRRAPRAVTFAREDLKDACKDGGYVLIGTRNQGRCVSTVNHTFPDGITIPGQPPVE